MRYSQSKQLAPHVPVMIYSIKLFAAVQHFHSYNSFYSLENQSASVLFTEQSPLVLSKLTEF